jgi:hypothetical protein
VVEALTALTITDTVADMIAVTYGALTVAVIIVAVIDAVTVSAKDAVMITVTVAVMVTVMIADLGVVC